MLPGGSWEIEWPELLTWQRRPRTVLRTSPSALLWFKGPPMPCGERRKWFSVELSCMSISKTSPFNCLTLFKSGRKWLKHLKVMSSQWKNANNYAWKSFSWKLQLKGSNRHRSDKTLKKDLSTLRSAAVKLSKTMQWQVQTLAHG